MGVDLRYLSHRILFLLLLPALSAGIAWLCNIAVQAAVPPRWLFLVDSVGALGAYALLYKVIDRWAWKTRPFTRLGITRVPNLEGRWKGTVDSSYDGGTIRGAILEIWQTFSTITVCGYFPDSQSASRIADFVTAYDGALELHYEYQNDPGVKAGDTMHIHLGTAQLRHHADRQELEGWYYNRGRDRRGHVGTLNFEFQQKVRTRRSDW